MNTYNSIDNIYQQLTRANQFDLKRTAEAMLFAQQHSPEERKCRRQRDMFKRKGIQQCRSTQ